MRLEKSFSLPIFLSVSLHTLLLVLFLGDWNFFKKEPEPYKPHYVTATLVDMKPKAKAAPQQTKEQVLDSKAYEDLKNNKKQDEQRRKEAEAMVQKKKEQEAKAAAAEAEKVKQQKIKEEQAKIAKAKAEKEAAEKKRKAEELAKQQAEAAKKTKREQEAQEEQRRIQAALQKEAKHISDTNDDVNTKSYEEMLIERVQQNWSRPPSARNGLEVTLEVNMLPTGVVTGLRVVRSSGDPAFDRSAEQAVKRVDRFTEAMQIPPDIFEKYFRVFRFTFSPEDLRS
ncbi:protein TolA [Cellvibrio mixtus]|jgi:colicin import membrane protein|uniref:Protein TolA n=1 Tax=Cellvibrio mixtus TaxID=39650 RepID=A0A266Q3Z3_9GAMM|nr:MULTISPECIES: cell envelope integrity protein TolA [Cellvibrio]AQT58866.1 protein TolA [Cellvibrio sp. PSBB023]OZY84346.1 protein TolA [Cellvibrio mixtus]